MLHEGITTIDIRSRPVEETEGAGLEVTLNGETVRSLRNPADGARPVVRGNLDLTESERTTVEQWGELTYPLTVVVEAVRQS